MSIPETTTAVAPPQWASKVCMCCYQWFDYLMRDRERQPLVCKVCAGDQT